VFGGPRGSAHRAIFDAHRARPVYFPESTDGLNLDEMTLGNVLHDAQYRTMCLGKWHLGSQPQYLPTRRGFDAYFGVPYSVDMRPLPMLKDEAVLEPDTDRALLTPRYTGHAVEFIESAKGQPFFLYLAYSYPHIPIDASPRFKGKSKQGIYGDAVEEIDWSVGEILASLERNHLDDNTLLMFTGDHGPWYQGSVEKLRGRKGTTYEGGCRVPFLARWKGVFPAGHVADGFASHLDVVPTVVSICGAKAPEKPLDGTNIVDLLTGRKKEIDRPGMLYFSPLGDTVELQCIRRGDWKLRFSQFTRSTFVLGSPTGQNLMLAQPELYNLANDPGENYDVARDYPQVVAELQREI
jgi:arylsulfatase A